MLEIFLKSHFSLYFRFFDVRSFAGSRFFDVRSFAGSRFFDVWSFAGSRFFDVRSFASSRFFDGATPSRSLSRKKPNEIPRLSPPGR